MALRDVLEQVRADIASGHANKANEQEAKDWFITPILQALGWRGPGRVRLEHPAGQERVKMDFALQGADRKIVALIEAKAPGSSLASHVGQVMTYAFFEGVDICVLTTGVVWWLYLPREKGDPTTRRFAELDVRSDDLNHLESTLSKCLEYKALTSGEAEEHARAIRDARQNEKRLLAELPSAWQRLLDGPDNLLVELVQEEAHKAVGLRPSKEQVAAFLANLGAQKPSVPLPAPPHPPTTSTGPNTKRDAEIVRLRDGGMSFAKIGERFGLSHTRVSNIYRERKNPPATPPGGGISKPERDAEIVRLRDGGMSFSKIAQRFNLSAVRVRKIYLRETTSRPPEIPQDDPLTGFALWGTRYSERTWIGVWLNVVEAVYNRHSDEFERAFQLRGRSRQYISSSTDGPRRSRRIGTSPYYAYVYLNAAQCEQLARKLLELFGYGADELEILYD